MPPGEFDKRPNQLSIPERAAVYRHYFDDVLASTARSTGAASGSRVLDKVGNAGAAAALDDTLFRHGRAGGARLIQRAVNSTAGAGTVTEDGKMGPATFEAFRRLVQDGESRTRLLDRLATLRKETGEPGEAARFDHFRFSAQR